MQSAGHLTHAFIAPRSTLRCSDLAINHGHPAEYAQLLHRDHLRFLCPVVTGVTRRGQKTGETTDSHVLIRHHLRTSVTRGCSHERLNDPANCMYALLGCPRDLGSGRKSDDPLKPELQDDFRGSLQIILASPPTESPLWAPYCSISEPTLHTHDLSLPKNRVGRRRT